LEQEGNDERHNECKYHSIEVPDVEPVDKNKENADLNETTSHPANPILEYLLYIMAKWKNV
jgi:hypothetical protein